MKPPLFRYEAPRTLRDAIATLSSDVDAMVLAGGQSLLPAMNFRVAAPSLLVDIQHVEGLKGIAIEAGACLVLEREAAIAAADRAGLFVIGVAAA